MKRGSTQRREYCRFAVVYQDRQKKIRETEISAASKLEAAESVAVLGKVLKVTPK